jgi:hypothetical protein
MCPAYTAWIVVWCRPSRQAACTVTCTSSINASVRAFHPAICSRPVMATPIA